VPLVPISVLDGEIVHAEIDGLSFDRLLLEGGFRGADPHDDRARFPLSAVRQVVTGHPQPARTPAESDAGPATLTGRRLPLISGVGRNPCRPPSPPGNRPVTKPSGGP
jgi:hypothetical protein